MQLWWLRIISLKSLGHGKPLRKNTKIIKKIMTSVIASSCRGLINCHAHLEYGNFRNKINERHSFSEWVKSMIKLKETSTLEDHQNAVRLGALEMIKNGTTFVVDHSATGAAFQMLFNTKIRSVIMLEVLGPNAEKANEDFNEALEKASGFLANEYCHWGIHPHAPYSTCSEIYEKCIRYAEQNDVLLSTHIGESQEEWDMFSKQEGPLLELVSKFGFKMDKAYPLGLLNFLKQKGIQLKKSLVVHGNYLSKSDFKNLKKGDCTLVICPQSHQYFSHKVFPMDAFAVDINIALGTDSLASNESLNLFDEMFILKSNYPQIPYYKILEMVTINAAKAVGRSHDLGVLKKGYKADFIALKVGAISQDELYETIIQKEVDIKAVVINGEPILI